MNRKTQMAFFCFCSVLLLGFWIWRQNYFLSPEDVLKVYAEDNHMGEVQAVLLEREFGERGKEYTVILGKCERGLAYVGAEKVNPFLWRYDFQADEEGYAFAQEGVAVIYVTKWDEFYGYSEREDIAELICWGGTDEKSCRKIFCYPYPQSGNAFLFLGWEEEWIAMGDAYKFGWSFGDLQIFAVEGRNEKGETIYWSSVFGFAQEEFEPQSIGKLVRKWIDNGRKTLQEDAEMQA